MMARGYYRLRYVNVSELVLPTFRNMLYILDSSFKGTRRVLWSLALCPGKTMKNIAGLIQNRVRFTSKVKLNKMNFNLKVHNMFPKVTFAPWLHPVKIWLHTVSR